MIEAKNTELEVVTSIKINKLKTDLFNSNKEIKKLREEKKLQEKLVEAKEKDVKKCKSSNQFVDDLVDKSLGVFNEGFEDCKKKVKEFLLDFNTTLFISSIDALKKYQ